jgi:hypothetical protein
LQILESVVVTLVRFHRTVADEVEDGKGGSR